MIILTILVVAMFLCLAYLTVDHVISEIKRDRETKRELDDWNAPPPKEYDPNTRKTKKRA